MLKVNYVITDEDITLNFNNQTHIIPRNSKTGEQVIAALKSGNKDLIPDLVDQERKVANFSKGNCEIKNGNLFLDGKKVSDYLGKKIMSFMENNLPYEPLLEFSKKLSKNPSFRAVNELYEFLEKNNHPLTEDGNFIAYKKVREDFYDCHTGTMLNSPGSILSMPRNEVDEDSTRTCSSGLHVANWDYADNFYTGGVMLEIEVNPEHVCAIPEDYNQSKMRVCEYKVLEKVDRPHSLGTELKKKEVITSALTDDYREDEDDKYECESCGGEFSDGELDDGLCDDCSYEQRKDEESGTQEIKICFDCDADHAKDQTKVDNYDQHDFWKW